MSAPEKIVAYTTTTLAKNIKLTYKSRLWEEHHCPFMPDNARLYIRQDIHEATLAERDKEIAELKQAAKFDRHNSDDWKTMIDSNAEMEKTITELRRRLMMLRCLLKQ